VSGRPGSFARKVWLCGWTVLTSALLAASDGYAHLVTTELGPFYDGAAHPLVSLEDLLTLVGLAILASHAGRATGRRLLAILVIAWTLGAMAGFALAPVRWEAPVPTAAVILLLGALGALKMRVAAVFLLAGAGIVGLGHGLMNGSAIQFAGGPWLTVSGLACGLFVSATLLTGMGTWLHDRRAAIILRVSASWVAAIGLLMLGWQIRS